MQRRLSRLFLIVACLSAAALSTAGARASVPAGGDREAFATGVALLREGKSEEALIALRRAEKSFGDEVPAALLADLALAAQGVGAVSDAAAYAERAAAKDERFVLLRDTVVGAVRLREGWEALEGQPADLDKASDAAQRSVRAFRRALRAQPDSDRARRNFERALRLEAEVEKRKKEQEKKEKEQDKDEKKDEQKQDEQKQDDKEQEQQKQEEQQDQQKQDQQRQDQQKQDQQKQDQQKQDEQQQDQQQKKQQEQDEQKQDRDAPDPAEDKAAKPEEKPADPGETDDETKAQMRELSPSELRQLKQKLAEILEEKTRIRVERRPKPKPGKKDW